MRDIPYDPNAESTYECFHCGITTTSLGHPGDCPDCGSSLRNLQMPME